MLSTLTLRRYICILLLTSQYEPAIDLSVECSRITCERLSIVSHMDLFHHSFIPSYPWPGSKGSPQRPNQSCKSQSSRTRINSQRLHDSCDVSSEGDVPLAVRLHSEDHVLRDPFTPAGVLCRYGYYLQIRRTTLWSYFRLETFNTVPNSTGSPVHPPVEAEGCNLMSWRL